MPSKRQRDQRNAARAASVLTYKKRRLEASSLPNLSLLETDHDRRNTSATCDTSETRDTTDTNHTEGESGTKFWNKSANESDLHSKGERDSDGDISDLEPERSRAEPVASPRLLPAVLKWNQDGEQKLRGSYGRGSKSTSRRQRISAQEHAKEASKSYNITALWQRNQDLGLVSSASTQGEPGQPSNSASVYPVVEVPRGQPPLLSTQEIHKS